MLEDLVELVRGRASALLGPRVLGLPHSAQHGFRTYAITVWPDSANHECVDFCALRVFHKRDDRRHFCNCASPVPLFSWAVIPCMSITNCENGSRYLE